MLVTVSSGFISVNAIVGVKFDCSFAHVYKFSFGFLKGLAQVN